MGSTYKQGNPNGNQNREGTTLSIGQKTIQKAKAHPAEGDRQRGMLSFFLEKGEKGNLSS